MKSEKDKYHRISLMWNIRNKQAKGKKEDQQIMRDSNFNYREETDGYQCGAGLENGLNKWWE